MSTSFSCPCAKHVAHIMDARERVNRNVDASIDTGVYVYMYMPNVFGPYVTYVRTYYYTSTYYLRCARNLYERTFLKSSNLPTPQKHVNVQAITTCPTPTALLKV